MCNNNSMEKIGIFGGTFNPVHVEHVNIVKSAIKELNLDLLYVVPTKTPPHKDVVPISAEHRFNMLKLALENVDKVCVSDFEINSTDKSYSYLTVLHFRKKHPNAKLYLIMGLDMLADFKTWKNPNVIVENATIAAFNRKGFKLDFEKERQLFKNNFHSDFILNEYFGQEVSSTEIRISANLNLKIPNVDKKVEEYIYANQIYKGDYISEFLINNLTNKRLVHTVNVATAAVTKARETGLSENKIILAALLHDCAKYLDYKNFKDFTLPPSVPEKVVHAFLGEHVARTVLKIEDEEVLDAIKYHTTAKPNISLLGKLIFVADMVEKDRNYQGVEVLRELFKGNLETCFKECLREEVIHLKNRGDNIYPLTLQANAYYNGQKGE